MYFQENVFLLMFFWNISLNVKILGNTLKKQYLHKQFLRYISTFDVTANL